MKKQNIYIILKQMIIMKHIDENILSFFKTENTQDFELILLKIVKELILKKELKDVN